jgi:hypothetical protein
MLDLRINIGDISTELKTDTLLTFDDIESLLSRAVKSTLDAYLSLPIEDRLASLGLDNGLDNDDEDDD